MRYVPIASETYDSGKRKGEARFLSFSLNALRPADYPALATTTVKTKDGPVLVPTVDVAASDVQVAQADSVSEIVALYPTSEAGEAALVGAWNDAIRTATRKEAGARFANVKAFTGDVAGILSGLADSVVRAFTHPTTKPSKSEQVKVVASFAANLASMSDEDALAQLKALRAQLGIAG